jgi:hypothetical protein
MKDQTACNIVMMISRFNLQNRGGSLLSNPGAVEHSASRKRLFENLFCEVYTHITSC